MWNAIAFVTGGITLVAFVVAVVYWSYRRHLLNKERLVASVPEAERPRILEDFLEAVHVSTADLTKEQRFVLAKEIISARTSTTRQRAIVLVVIGLIAGGVTMFALLREKAVAEEPSSSQAGTTSASALPSTPRTHIEDRQVQASILTASDMRPGPSQPVIELGPQPRAFILRGTVVNGTTGEPLPGVQVTARTDKVYEATTDSDGRVRFDFTTFDQDIPVELSVRSVNYVTSADTLVLAKANTAWRVQLTPKATQDASAVMPSSTPEVETQTLVTNLLARDFDAIHAKFSPDLKTKVPPQKLATEWIRILDAVGTARAVSKPRRENFRGRPAYVVTYEGTNYTGKLFVAFNERSEVDTFWFDWSAYLAVK